MGRLENKTVLIIGGTSGIGAACAKRFAAEGADVIITGRSQKEASLIVNEAVSAGEKMSFYYCDVSCIEDIKKLKTCIVHQYQKLDILFNNAGILYTAPLEEIQDEKWVQTFDINTHSVMRIVREFIDLILNSKGNILVNASIDGLQSLCRGRANYSYSASKAAIIKFTQQLALNYTPKGIRVNCLCPGVTKTNLFTNKDFSRFIGSVPMGRVADAEEIANAALFLVSDEASYVSGAVLTVDGAASLL